MSAELSMEAVPQSGQGKVAKNAIIYLFAQLISWSVSFLAISIIPRRLGETAMGELALAQTLVSTVSGTLMLSIDPYLVAEVGRDQLNAERLLNAALGLRLLLILPLIGFSILLLHLNHASHVTWMLAYFTMGSASINLLAEPMRSVLAGWEEAKRVSALDFTWQSAALWSIPFLRFGPIAMPISNLSMLLITMVMRIKWLFSRISLRPNCNVALWTTVIKGGLPFFMNTFVVQFYTLGSVLILRRYSGDAEVGVFSQALRLQGTFLFIPTAIGMALLPSLTRLTDVDEVEFKKMQTKVLSLMLALSLPVTTMIIMLAVPFCHLLYGKSKFQDMPLALQVSAFNLIPLYVTTIMYRFLVAQRKNGIWSIFLIGTVALNALFCWILIPITMRYFHNGSAGAMAASMIAESVTVVFAFVLLGTNPLSVQAVTQVFRGLVAAVSMGCVIWLTRNMMIIFPATLGMLTFCYLAYHLHVFGEEEQQKLVAMIQQKLGRRKNRGQNK